ncbi:S-adenosyl-L-methionine-dependent methyltransferase [Schizothecium vesticola]|uniref:S-adenosyl-L-methionine-dependent methyltransferase n=1 Tax=Schizothecium vesticola TaxID=314040 RepID=A0AA40F7U7_9PEZI|nr:S-adenosyl-L-methionine-dependent methyltransferase [Schizothecium vesticola]
MAETSAPAATATPTAAAPSSPSPAPAAPAPVAARCAGHEFDAADGESAYSDGGESDTTSLKFSILGYRKENGRTYHAYKDGTCLLPNDESEKDRLDLQHHLFSLTFDGKLQLAPLPKKPDHILDIGCGTGAWSIDSADDHSEVHVADIDLSSIQPSFVPLNVTFIIDDVEDTWAYPHPFDYVFCRFMTGAPCFGSLTPGGVIEVQDCVFTVLSDDGTITDVTVLFKWMKVLPDGMARFQHPLDSALRYRAQLEAAGFVGIVEYNYKWPINRWPKDPKYKEIGLWAYENFSAGISTFSLAIMTRSKDEKHGRNHPNQIPQIAALHIFRGPKKPSYLSETPKAT